MEKMEKLWEYMLEDMKADRIDQEIRRSSLRQKLEYNRDFIMERQKTYQEMEEHVAVSIDRKDAIRDALARALDQLQGLQRRADELSQDDLEGCRALREEVEKCRKNIISYETEMRRIEKEGTDFDIKSRTIRQETAAAKQEFDRLKITYNQETKDKKVALAEQRAKADALLVGVDRDLLEVYNGVKRQITPPMARLIGGQCSGCNTSQPSAALRRIEAGNELVECETCGRILIK